MMSSLPVTSPSASPEKSMGCDSNPDVVKDLVGEGNSGMVLRSFSKSNTNRDVSDEVNRCLYCMYR